MIRLRRSGSTPVRFRIVTSIDLTDYTATLEIGNFSAETELDGGYGTVVVPQTVAIGLTDGKGVSTVTVKDALENTVQTLRVDTFAVDGEVFDSETEVPITLVPDCNNWSGGGDEALKRIRQCVAPLNADKSPIHDIVTSLQSI